MRMHCEHQWERFGHGAFLCQDCNTVKNSRCDACDGRLSKRGDSLCRSCAALAGKVDAGGQGNG